MKNNLTKLFLQTLMILLTLNIISSSAVKNLQKKNSSLLIHFTCAVAKDELEKHPEMRTIAMIELENNFPSDFSAKVLKCLPDNVTKVNLWKINDAVNNSMTFSKSTLVIYVADKLKWDQSSYAAYFINRNFVPEFNHLSKFLFVSSKEAKNLGIRKKFPNVVQIFGKNQKVIARRFDMIGNLETVETFKSAKHENLSQILFHDKTNNLNGHEIFAVWRNTIDSHRIDGSERPNCKWNFFLDIVTQKMNAKLKFCEINVNYTNNAEYSWKTAKKIGTLLLQGKVDFLLSFSNFRSGLRSYENVDWCFLVPLPEEYSIAEQILFLPLDMSCWMWLGITIAVSTSIWRISEGHWNFLFGAFSYLVGQSQLVVRIRTSRLMMKSLLQILILTFFIFSNGYQSLVTSFMLNPVRQNLFKSIDELLDSNVRINIESKLNATFKENPKYQKALLDGRAKDYELPFNSKLVYETLAERNLALILPCKVTKNKIERIGDGKTWRKMYLIDEAVYSVQQNLFTPFLHPYVEEFQKLMDRSLEAGLLGAWEIFYYAVLNEIQCKNGSVRPQSVPEKEILEIFHQDCVSELSSDYFKRRFKNPFKKEIKRKQRKVKRIQVRPTQ